ncbi:hypothetical protein V1264_001307 [Littorina saxatilis]|uniref:Uncharacterized protein n=1 Tax=Littorina saxatilis TaxID=31220 RepID=A0AAN9C151_9CAEN
MGMKEKATSPVMSDENTRPSSSVDRSSPSDVLPRVDVSQNDTVDASALPNCATVAAPVSVNPQLSGDNTPHSSLSSGPRLHPIHSDRPSSAPPHHLERLSGVILRKMGDHYQTTTYGQTLRMMGDQMTFENEIRRALSSGDLDRLQNSSNTNR